MANKFLQKLRLRKVKPEESDDDPKKDSVPDIPPIPVANGDNQETILQVELPPRAKWRWKSESLVVLMSYNVNINCMWTLPYLAMKYGGGLARPREGRIILVAFFIPYSIVTLLLGIPLYMLQLTLGQYSRFGATKVWSVAPFFKGIGFASIISTFFVCVYYAAELAWFLYYFAVSLSRKLPWVNCANQEYSTAACSLVPPNCTTSGQRCLSNFTYIYGHPSAQLANSNDAKLIFPDVWKLPADEYFLHTVLRLTPTIEHTGVFGWRLILCLLAVWILILLVLLRGATSAGKVSYYTLISPYVFAIILYVGIVQFDGAAKGLYTYVVPDFEKMSDIKLWGEAALLAFYTLFTNWGTVVTLGSFNMDKDNFHEDAILAPIGCLLSSFFFGLLPSMLLGVLAENLGLTINQILAYGPNLLFVACAQGATYVNVAAPFWSCLFYLTLFILGFGSLMWMVETIVVGLVDLWPQRLRHLRISVLLAIISVSFLFGFAFVSASGLYVTLLFENYVARWNILILALIEVAGLAAVYGIKRFRHLMSYMVDFESPLLLWRILLTALVPDLLLLMIIYSFAVWSPVSFSGVAFPPWAQAIGWLLALFPLLLIPIFMVIVLVKAEGPGLKEKLRTSCQVTEEWPIEGEPAVCPCDPGTVVPFPEGAAAPAVAYSMNKISATEHALKPGKINRSSQSSVDVETQTGTQDTESIASSSEPERHRKKHKKHKKDRRKEKLPTIVDEPEITHQENQRNLEIRENVSETEDPNRLPPAKLPPLLASPREKKKKSKKHKSTKSEEDEEYTEQVKEQLGHWKDDLNTDHNKALKYEVPGFEDGDMGTTKTV